jgi:riboflavin biosynthesis pyrimidine reductase
MRRLYPTAGQVEGAAALENEYLVTADRHVRANFVITVDGMVELDGRSSSLSSEADRAAFMAMRAVADVVLVGAGTLRTENYGPVRLESAVQDRRRSRQQAPVPPLAIVSNRADLDPAARVFSGDTKPFILTSATGAADHAELTGVAEVIACGDQSVDVAVALDELYARGLGRVLCEGGPALTRSLLGAALLDELCCSTSPVLAGAGHHGLLGEEPLAEPVSLRLVSVLEGDDMLLARYQRGVPA